MPEEPTPEQYTAWLTRRFFDLGTQYYIAGRFGFFGWLNPVTATLLHHAVEMFLKGYLCRTLTEQQRRTHSLTFLWRAFKRETGDPTLSRFDDIVSGLDRFEDLRYPEKVQGHLSGLMLYPGPTPTAPPIETPPFILVLSPVDELVRLLFEKVPFDPSVFAMSLTTEAKNVLTRDNQAASVWL